jgi:hypothetical protein
VAEPTDWKVRATLDRDLLVEDIAKLAGILARQRVGCVVSAVDEEDAVEKAKTHLLRYSGIPEAYMKTLNPRRLPT